MPDYTKISQGTLYDPTNGIDGEVRDLWVSDGRIVEPPTDPSVKPNRVIDASGKIVVPGGIEPHAHIAAPFVAQGQNLSTAPPEQVSRAALFGGTAEGALPGYPSCRGLGEIPEVMFFPA